MLRNLLVYVLLAPSAAVLGQTGFKPLTDLGAGLYQGSQGGLYPGGLNVRPQGHEAAGVIFAGQVKPRDAQGNLSEAGKIGLLTIGMSNTRQESQSWGSLIAQDPQVNPKLVFVNGAQGGQTAEKIADETGQGAQFWSNVDTFLTNAGISRLQVQAIWLKEADASPNQGWPGYANKLKDELIVIAGILKRRFPNCNLCFLSSRIYAGYATTGLNPEPYAYESGFSVKWLIQEQINGNPALNFGAGSRSVRPRSPWLSWGPYTWADGPTPRSDGLTWMPPEFAADGTHPSAAGAQKVAQMLMTFFKNDPATRPWFVANP